MDEKTMTKTIYSCEAIANSNRSRLLFSQPQACFREGLFRPYLQQPYQLSMSLLALACNLDR